MTTKSQISQKPDAAEASLAYYTREAPKANSAPEPTPIEQMFGYYAA